jgi:hypothetical protein
MYYNIAVKAYLGEPGNRNNFFISFRCLFSMYPSCFNLANLDETLHKEVRIQLDDSIVDFHYWYFIGNDDNGLRLHHPFTSDSDRRADLDLRAKLQIWGDNLTIEIWMHDSAINYISNNWDWDRHKVELGQHCCYNISNVDRSLTFSTTTTRRSNSKEFLDTIGTRYTLNTSRIAYWKFEIRSMVRKCYSFGVTADFHPWNHGDTVERLCDWKVGDELEQREDREPYSEIFEIVYHGPEDRMVLYRDGIKRGDMRMGNDRNDEGYYLCSPFVTCPPGTVCTLLETKQHFQTLQQLCERKIYRVVHSQNVMCLPLPKLLKVKILMKR